MVTAQAKGRRKGEGWPRVVQAEEGNSRGKGDGKTWQQSSNRVFCCRQEQWLLMFLVNIAARTIWVRHQEKCSSYWCTEGVHWSSLVFVSRSLAVRHATVRNDREFIWIFTRGRNNEWPSEFFFGYENLHDINLLCCPFLKTLRASSFLGKRILRKGARMILAFLKLGVVKRGSLLASQGSWFVIGREITSEWDNTGPGTVSKQCPSLYILSCWKAKFLLTFHFINDEKLIMASA